MKRSAFTMLELLIVMLIVATLMALIVPAVLKVREAQGRTRTVSFLKQLTLPLHGCNDVHGRLPPATGDFGNPAVNATLLIHLMPFFEQDNLYKMIVAGSAPDLHTVVVTTFVSPLDSPLGNGEGITNFAGNLRAFSDLGWKTEWNKTITPDANGNDPETNVPWYYGTASIPRSLPDGTSNTIALVTQYSRCGSPSGLNYFANSAGETKNSPFFGYYAPRFAASRDDGIKNGRAGVIFQILPTIEDCNPSHTPQSLLRSGITISLFDGSARMVRPTISMETWGLAVQPNDGLHLGTDWNQ